MESLDASSHIRRKKMEELKMELGQIGMRRGSASSITSTPTDIRHVDEWRMDLTAAEKRRLQQAEAKASAGYPKRPRFYLDEKLIKVIKVIRSMYFYYTANVLSVKNPDVCLRSKSKSNHWLSLH